MYYDVVIIGAGISGLSAALEAEKLGIKSVLILEHQKHIGGMQSLLFKSSQFQEENKLLDKIKDLSYECWFNSTVIGFFPGDENQTHQIFVQTTNGTKTIEAKSVILASGSLQQPREADKIPGSRPFGVMTSLLAKNLLDSGFLPGEDILMFERTRIDIAIKEDIQERGIKIRSIPFEDYRLLNIHGIHKVTSVFIEHCITGKVEEIPCDSLLYSAGRIPSTFYLKQTLIERNEHLAVKIDSNGQSSVPNVYAIGSCTDKGDDNHHNSASMAKKVIKNIVPIIKESQKR